MHRLIFFLWCLLFTSVMLFALNIVIKSIDFVFERKKNFCFQWMWFVFRSELYFPLNFVISYKKLWNDFNSILSVKAERVDFFIENCGLWCGSDAAVIETPWTIIFTFLQQIERNFSSFKLNEVFQTKSL